MSKDLELLPTVLTKFKDLFLWLKVLWMKTVLWIIQMNQGIVDSFLKAILKAQMA